MLESISDKIFQSNNNNNDRTAVNGGTTFDVHTKESEEMMTTTHGNVDSSALEATVRTKLDLMASLKNLPNLGLQEDIKKYLAKPAIIATGNLATTDGITTFTNYNCMGAIASLPVHEEKLRGFYGIRATAVYKLQVNANKFQQGRYMLVFCPTGGTGYTGDVRSIEWLKAHKFSVMQLTQLPHIEIDLATCSEVTLKIPFYSSFLCAPITQIVQDSGLYDTGVVQIAPYFPLVTAGGSTIASYSLWGSFEDVELFGASIPYNAQMGSRLRSSRKGRDAIAEEQDNAAVAPLSSSFRLLSKAATVAGNVPLLSSIAAPVAWAADVSSKVCAALGWSKPNGLAPPNRFERSVFSGICNVDGAPLCQPLSGFENNRVDVLPGFSGTNEDEMSFDYLKSIPSFYKSYLWTTSQVTSTQLAAIPLNPRLMYNAATLGTETCESVTPVCLLARMFSLARGGLNFTIKFVKTQFHSGRLLVAYQPAVFNTVAVADIPKTAYLHREIIDIRDSNEFTFTVPFEAISGYIETEKATEYFGYLTVFVLDQLVAPATVSSSVRLLVEVSGAPDFEVAVPRALDFDLVIPYAPQMGPILGDEMHWEPQMGLGSTGDPPSGMMIGNASIKVENCDAAAACIGEKIISLRSLVKREVLVKKDLTITDTQNLIMPTAAGYACDMSTSMVSPTAITDYFTLCSGIYMFSRGGVRVGLLSSGGDSYPIDTSLYHAEYDRSDISDMVTYYPDVDAREKLSSNLKVISRGDLNSGVRVQVPQYTHTISRCNKDSMQASTVASFTFASDYVPGRALVYVDKSLNSSHLFFTRGGADDCNFGLFVSIPPLRSTAYKLEAVTE